MSPSESQNILLDNWSIESQGILAAFPYTKSRDEKRRAFLRKFWGSSLCDIIVPGPTTFLGVESASNLHAKTRPLILSELDKFTGHRSGILDLAVVYRNVCQPRRVGSQAKQDSEWIPKAGPVSLRDKNK
ncbi:hypothetical protein ANO11243_070340 [Dothideomycetidae sp. 11243]|nr:hypothetical protein ANO11243_070340 [fungal sp. No.11243]